MIIDRFEGDFAVCETETGTERISKKLLPNGAREGDVLVARENGLEIDVETTRKRWCETEKIMKKIYKDKS